MYITGWWYGVVGHLESCDGNENFCHCHNTGKSVKLMCLETLL